MDAHERDDLILRYLDGGDPRELESMLSRDPQAGRRLAELALVETMLGEVKPATRRMARPRRLVWPFAAAAAAVLFAALLVLFTTDRSEPPTAKSKSVVPVPKSDEPAPRKRIQPPPPKEVPRKDASEPLKLDEPRPDRTTPKEEPKKDEPRREETPPKKSESEEPAITQVEIANVRGTLSRRSDGKISTNHRQLASFTMGDATVFLQLSTTVSLEPTRLTLMNGTVCVDAVKRLSIATPHAEATGADGSFQVELDEKRTRLLVLKGSVQFRTAKGDVTVGAGQFSIARPGERPSAPAKIDVDGPTAWRKRPDLSGRKEPFVAHEPGANRKLAGLVVAAPFGSGEKESLELARATAERLDAGLVYGENWRDVEKKFWINIDRGMEGDVGRDGKVANERFTDRARKATADYLDRLRTGAGVGPREAVPMVVQVRVQYQVGACEVAWTGWNKKTIAELKALYAQLLDKHKPSTRIEMRFEGVDEGSFNFAEADAKIEGYMNPRNARNAIAFFFGPAVGKETDTYSKILAEMIEFLNARRK